MSNYPTNLTDKQWQVIKNIVAIKERKRKHSLREIINALMYITKTGCQWRMLPHEFAPWQTVYFYFRKWKSEGVFEELMHHLRDVVRKSYGKAVSPSVGLIDSRSVRTSHHIDSRPLKSILNARNQQYKFIFALIYLQFFITLQ